jgi:cation:H+ antiporter
MIWAYLLFIIGFAVIIKGGDWFVDAAIWIAEVTGIPKMLIGATVVSFATTLPELFVSTIAVTSGAVGMGIGNAMGSSICNIGLTLAIGLCIRPSVIEKDLFYVKAGIMLLALAVLFAVSLDSVLTPWEALPLLALLAAFIYFNIHHIRRSNQLRRESEEPVEKSKKSVAINVLKFIAGSAGIVVGAELLVSNGTKIASSLGISEGIIGVSIVALGTSLPELVTAISAMRRKHTEMSIGNILGANILNITLILPVCALISGEGLVIDSEFLPAIGRSLPRTLYVDIPVTAVLFLLLIVPPLLMRGRLRRFQGYAMLAVYAAFIAFLALNL